MTAVKIVDRVRAPRDYQEKFMPRELALWPRLRHPNLIRFLDYFEDNQRVYMVGPMPVCMIMVNNNVFWPKIIRRTS